MKIKLLLPLFGLFVSLGFAQEKIVKGKVTDGKLPIEDVAVAIEGNDDSVFTDKDGNYEIMVDVGEKLVYTYAGMKTVSIRVEDVTRILNPIMIPDIKELEEVQVIASKRISQKDLEEDYLINKSIIRTAFGYLDADRAAGNIRFLNEDQINSVNLCILDLLRNEFPGVTIFGDCFRGGAVEIRGTRSLLGRNTAVYDVDGLILPDAPIWLNIDNIKRVAILNNLGATNAYGSIGMGGVVVINTIGGNQKPNTIVDRAKLRNNFEEGKVLTQAEVKANAPSYLKEMNASVSFEEAKKVFESYSGTYYNSPYFFLDAYTHFSEKRNEQAFADSIIEDNFGLFQNNAVLMKALAYIYEEQNRFDKANEMYKEVFILRPYYVQSYLDMADSYRDIDEPKQAASIYSRYEYLIQQGFLEADTLGFDPIMSREFNNLLALEKGNLMKGKNFKNLFVDKEGFEGTRLVFEWNDSEAEFDLQFVNPQNQYFKWKHSLESNADIIEREKDYGYSVMEELIDGSLPGQWSVNVKYYGNKSLTPTYLKATVYYNYGSKSQRKEIQTFKLDLKDVNQELFKLNVAGMVTQN